MTQATRSIPRLAPFTLQVKEMREPQSGYFQKAVGSSGRGGRWGVDALSACRHHSGKSPSRGVGCRRARRVLRSRRQADPALDPW